MSDNESVSSHGGSSIGTKSSVSSSTSFDMSTVAAAWPKKYAPLRAAVAHLLLDERLAKVRCSSDQLITPLNSLGGADGRSDVSMVDADLIKTAFSKGDNEIRHHI
jgi:hypothetical protein